jgi:hypothetical protein
LQEKDEKDEKEEEEGKKRSWVYLYDGNRRQWPGGSDSRKVRRGRLEVI